ncbi:MAG: hypothetical protein KGR19_08095 [Acidobacteria bacterium]|nr:hypothetical protein [Acidobacteriota bacterium]
MGSMRRVFPTAAMAACLALLAVPAASLAQDPPAVANPALPEGTVTKTYRFPLTVKPGQNLNLYNFLNTPDGTTRPGENGWIVGFRPNLRRMDGSTPPVDEIHLHHAVWVIGGRPTFAAGEEKTSILPPTGYGYRYTTDQRWILNHMIHNLTASPEKVWIEYSVDFLPDTAPAAASMKAVQTEWVDVMGTTAYPVFDVRKGEGTAGKLTYPRDTSAALAGRNRRLIDHDGTLVGTAGHLHPGGLYTELFLTRGDRTVKLFRSNAYYYGRAKFTSWNVSMGVPTEKWRIAVRKGDVLSVQGTYDTTKAAWLESMAISPTMMTTQPDGGIDPFTETPDQTEVLTHGELKENRDRGGLANPGLADPRKLKDGPKLRTVDIKDFLYQQGDLSLPGRKGRPPVVGAGKQLKFVNEDPVREIFHTVTPCKAPCNRSSGISYPLADAKQVDSGELGFGPVGVTAAANRADWSMPVGTKKGTYTYFCRVHPFMRGAFRVK